MTKIFLVLIPAFLFSSCKASKQEDPTKDYVLIEFASRLEEVYEKLEPEKYKQKQKQKEQKQSTSVKSF